MISMSGSVASSGSSTIRACCTLSQRIDVLEAQLRELRGSVEELQNSNESLRKQQRDLYADLDRRVKALESALRGGGARGWHYRRRLRRRLRQRGVGSTAAAGADDQTAYNHAFDALKNCDYSSAIAHSRSSCASIRTARWRTTRNTGSARPTT